MDRVTPYLTEHRERFERELHEYLRIPSVSADPDHTSDMQTAAKWVKTQLEQAGCEAKIELTEGHPIVVGRRYEHPDLPTVLVYGHYDVQPPDPLDLWTTPPFEPTVRDGKIYARGATDDKGQMLTHIKSVEAVVQSTGSLPVNVIFVIEGEEEVGSDNLDRFLEQLAETETVDVAVISDTSQYAPDQPAITYGLRGILAAEVKVTGPSADLHSGVFGGAVANPVNGLARMIAALHDDDGRIAIPGFYDDVHELSAGEREAFANLPFDEAEFRSSLGIDAVAGETGYSTLERRWTRPTCDINGIIGGYTGTGPKTIVPSTATAKISCRLVPDQDPEKLTDALEAHLRNNLPTGLTMEFHRFHGCSALAFDPSGPAMEAARRAITTAFGTAPVMIREGGSIPVVSSLQRVFGVDTLLLGWGLNTDNLHSPNEHFSLTDFHRGIHASAALWHELTAE